MPRPAIKEAGNEWNMSPFFASIPHCVFMCVCSCSHVWYEWVWAPLVVTVQPAVHNSCIRAGPWNWALVWAKLSQCRCLIRNSTYSHSPSTAPQRCRGTEEMGILAEILLRQPGNNQTLEIWDSHQHGVESNVRSPFIHFLSHFVAVAALPL